MNDTPIIIWQGDWIPRDHERSPSTWFRMENSGKYTVPIHPWKLICPLKMNGWNLKNSFFTMVPLYGTCWSVFLGGTSSYQNFQQSPLKTHVVRVSLLKQGWKATKRLPRNALRKASEKQQEPKSVQFNTGWSIWIFTLKNAYYSQLRHLISNTLSTTKSSVGWVEHCDHQSLGCPHFGDRDPWSLRISRWCHCS